MARLACYLLALLSAFAPAASRAAGDDTPPQPSASDDDTTSAPRVALLPLRPEGGVSGKEARGISALLRQEIEGAKFLRTNPARRDDDKIAKRCADDVKCLADVAYTRAIDLLGAGTLRPEGEGYIAALVVVAPGSSAPVRSVEERLGTAEQSLALGLRRLARRAFAPEMLTGVLDVRGTEGALLLVDNERRGRLPLPGPVAGLVEGDHTIEIRAKGYKTLTREVRIVFDETTQIDAILSKSVEGSHAVSARLEDDDGGTSVLSWLNTWGAVALVGVGGAALLAGIALGALSWADSVEVERRAQAQLLLFPRDQGLIQRGQALAIGANVLYVLSIPAIVGGGVWLGASLLLRGGDEE